jgi:hypothetical protein
MHAGDKEVGNLNSSVRRDGRNLNVLVAEGLMQNLQALGPYIYKIYLILITEKCPRQNFLREIKHI